MNFDRPRNAQGQSLASPGRQRRASNPSSAYRFPSGAPAAGRHSTVSGAGFDDLARVRLMAPPRQKLNTFLHQLGIYSPLSPPPVAAFRPGISGDFTLAPSPLPPFLDPLAQARRHTRPLFHSSSQTIDPAWLSLPSPGEQPLETSPSRESSLFQKSRPLSRKASQRSVSPAARTLARSTLLQSDGTVMGVNLTHTSAAWISPPTEVEYGSKQVVASGPFPGTAAKDSVSPATRHPQPKHQTQRATPVPTSGITHLPNPEITHLPTQPSSPLRRRGSRDSMSSPVSKGRRRSASSSTSNSLLASPLSDLGLGMLRDYSPGLSTIASTPSSSPGVSPRRGLYRTPFEQEAPTNASAEWAAFQK